MWLKVKLNMRFLLGLCIICALKQHSESMETLCVLDIDKYSYNSSMSRCLVDIKCQKDLSLDQTLEESAIKDVHNSVNKTISIINEGLHVSCLPTHVRQLFISINAAELNLTDLYIPISWTDIHEVNMSRNNIKEINDHSFGNVTDITFLDLSRNQIENISELAFVNHKGEAIAVRMLLLQYNNLKTLNCVLSTERYLDFLDISWNQLETLAWIEQSSFSHLAHLKANHNKITTIGSHFQALPGLSTLSLVGNMIKSISHSGFSYLHSLEFLDLSKNDIKTIQPTMFEGLTSLSYLNLSHNKIDGITEEYFTSSLILDSIDLSYNNLGQFGIAAGRSFIPIEKVFLNNNNLTEGEIVDLLTLPLKLHELHIGGNNLNCRNLMYRQSRDMVHNSFKGHPLEREERVKIICSTTDREEIFGISPLEQTISLLREARVLNFPQEQDFAFLKDILLDGQTILVEVKFHKHEEEIILKEATAERQSIDLKESNLSLMTVIWISVFVVFVLLGSTVGYVMWRKYPKSMYTWRTLRV